MEAVFAPFICVIGAVLLMAVIFLSASIRIVREDTRLSVYRLGRYIGDKGPGLVILMPVIDRGVPKQVGSLENAPGTRWAGLVGEAHTTIYTDGKVLLNGEEWSATSHAPISAGERVRVVRVILEVEKE